MRKYLLLFFLLLTPVLFASDSKNNPYWQIFLQLGYDTQQQGIDQKLAYENIEEFIRFSKEMLYHFQLTSETQDFVNEIRGKLASLDIGNLYDMLPYAEEGTTWKSLAVRGSRGKSQFAISLTDPHLKKWIPNRNSKNFVEWYPLQRLGDFSLRIFARPGAKDTYLFNTEAQSHLGNIQYMALVQGFKKLLQTVHLFSQKETSIPSSFREENSHLTLRGQRILYGFSRDFPHFYRVVKKFVNIRQILDINQPDPDRYLKIKLALQPKIEAFGKEYREIQKIMETLKGIFFFRFRFYDSQGHLVAMTELNSKTVTFQIQCLIEKGKLLKCKAPWEPLKTGEVDFSSPVPQAFKIVMDGKIDIKGIQILIRNFTLKVKYTLQKEGFQIGIHFDHAPKVFKIQGYLFGVIPLWLIDFFIPSNIDAIINEFLSTLARGNGGKGMETTLRMIHLPNNKNRFQVVSRAEVLSNGMIRFAFSFQSQAGLVNPKLHNEIRRFGRLFWHGFVADYLQFRYGE